jgi:bifunctional DNA-binding transcriptional regulator/antitoxin component of YhaV-PrlF toxin-antitoxin module
MANLKSKTKLELEAIGREHGVELDRRKSKAALVEEVTELIDGPQTLHSLKELEVEEPYLESAPAVRVDLVFNDEGLCIAKLPGMTKWIGKQLGFNSKVVKFATPGLARWYGNRRGGRAIKKENYYIVNKT